MITDTPWYVSNTVIWKDLQVKPSGTTRNKAIPKTLAIRSAYQIQYVIVVIVNMVFKV
jgi:hypothetical protein